MENTISIPRSTPLSVVTLSLCAGLAGGVWASSAFWLLKDRTPPVEQVPRSALRPAPPRQPAPPPPLPVTAAAYIPPQPVQCAADPGIQWTHGRYEISRAVIDRTLNEKSSLAAQARFVPSILDGRPNGFKVYAIRPCSLYARLGLLNADRVTSINGLDLSTPDKALGAYSELRAARDFAVEIERQGVVMALHYHIR